MIRTRLTCALAVTLALSCHAGTAAATVHHAGGLSWAGWSPRSIDSPSTWGFEFGQREFRGGSLASSDLWSGFRDSERDGDLRWMFGGSPFWEQQSASVFDDWFGRDRDAWAELARCLCHSLFRKWSDCGDRTVDVGTPASTLPDAPAALMPLPGTLPLIGAGLAALALLRRRRA